jgi:hypothetical protein
MLIWICGPFYIYHLNLKHDFCNRHKAEYGLVTIVTNES